jgi:hypothetical protein
MRSAADHRSSARGTRHPADRRVRPQRAVPLVWVHAGGDLRVTAGLHRESDGVHAMREALRGSETEHRHVRHGGRGRRVSGGRLA